MPFYTRIVGYDQHRFPETDYTFPQSFLPFPGREKFLQTIVFPIYSPQSLQEKQQILSGKRPVDSLPVYREIFQIGTHQVFVWRIPHRFQHTPAGRKNSSPPTPCDCCAQYPGHFYILKPTVPPGKLYRILPDKPWHIYFFRMSLQQMGYC